MSTLLFVCPTTGQQVSTGIEIDRSSFKSLPRHTTELHCPRCHKSHLLSGVWAWLGEEDLEGRLARAGYDIGSAAAS
jgi:hypothetical protein